MLVKSIIFIIVNSIAVLVSCYLVPGASVESIWVAAMVAIVLALVNFFLKPILVLLTLPISIITLGLFYFILNALLILLVEWIVPGFHLESFWTAIWFSIVISVVSWLINLVTGK